ncbi:MAG: helix-turn-helix domain-containing protein, partial [Desulfotomaculales bacterium]
MEPSPIYSVPAKTKPRLAYTVEETARLLGLSPATVYRMVYDGRIPFKRTGKGEKNRIIIPAAALEKWLNDPDEATGVAVKKRNKIIAMQAAEKL